MNREETIDCILRHNLHITRDLAGLAWDQDHEDWGPVLDMAAYQRKVDIYTREWRLPPRPVEAYYDFRFLQRGRARARPAAHVGPRNGGRSHRS